MGTFFKKAFRITKTPVDRKVFGVPLDELIEKQTSFLGVRSKIPQVIEKCIERLDKHGLELEGIFREGASQSKVHALRAQIDESGRCDFESVEDSHEVANVLKLFLRDLPDPLMTYQLYEQWIDIAKLEDEHRQVDAIRSTMTELPNVNFETLKTLLSFLKRVNSHSGKSLMHASNLAIVFGPNLLHYGNRDPLKMLVDTQHVTKLVSFMITNYSAIYSDSGDGSSSANQSGDTPAGTSSARKTGNSGTVKTKGVDHGGATSANTRETPSSRSKAHHPSQQNVPQQSQASWESDKRELLKTMEEMREGFAMEKAGWARQMSQSEIRRSELEARVQQLQSDVDQARRIEKSLSSQIDVLKRQLGSLQPRSTPKQATQEHTPSPSPTSNPNSTAPPSETASNLFKELDRIISVSKELAEILMTSRANKSGSTPKSAHSGMSSNGSAASTTRPVVVRR